MQYQTEHNEVEVGGIVKQDEYVRMDVILDMRLVEIVVQQKPTIVLHDNTYQQATHLVVRVLLEIIVLDEFIHSIQQQINE
ncbi:MAG: hypothetical protein LBQ59_00485 [Candidatus Peribacteria bacterium]|jgi:hypothetical protein|nr:hypothetical protein [Candidatus Peribacteria bacterium]